MRHLARDYAFAALAAIQLAEIRSEQKRLRGWELRDIIERKIESAITAALDLRDQQEKRTT